MTGLLRSFNVRIMQTEEPRSLFSAVLNHRDIVQLARP